MEKIGIIGSGIVAQTLGAGLLKHGYAVMLGTRSPEKLTDWLDGPGNGAAVGSVNEAAKFGKILILAVKGTAAKTVLKAIEPEFLRGKTIMDTTNPIADSPPQDGVLHFFTGPNESLMEQLQDSFPDSDFVKAFNSVGSGRMVNPDFESTPGMFICGNSENAKAQIANLVKRFGWEIEDMGSAVAARAIEPLCMLWCIPGFRENRWTHAFKLLK